MTDKKTKKSQIWGGRLEESPLEANVRFCAGRDVSSIPMADQLLVFYDIWTNLAHSKMLSKVGVLTQAEYQAIYQGLIDIDPANFPLDPAKEDVHINLEHHLVQTKGILAGKKIHSGRSRNDQVSTDMRLYLRAEVLGTLESLVLLTQSIINKAQEHTESVMPGFTHYQPGMPSTAGHWLSSWSQGLLRDLHALLGDLAQLNECPLGSAASFGTSWPIDRELTAELLAFDKVQANTLDSISSRGEHETRVTSNIAVLMNRLSQVSQDLILWTTPFYKFAKIADRYVTGSSIMPQKRNPDFAEIIRAKAAQVSGTLTSLLGIQKGAMSGYNRDSQQTKYLIMDLFREIQGAPVILSGVIDTLTFDLEQLRRAATQDFMNSADVADWLAQTFDLSFRDCYEILSLAVKYSALESDRLTLSGLTQAVGEAGFADQIQLTQEQVDHLNDPVALLERKSHTGAPSPKSVSELLVNQQAELDGFKTQIDQWGEKIGVTDLRTLAGLKP